MHFVALLRALDELVYEIMSWLVFYPITLWRTMRHPLAMMEYADTELEDRASERYTDTLSPPLFLLVTLLISHGIELAFVGQNEIVGDRTGLGKLISDDESLIILRLLIFSSFPMLMAVEFVRAKRTALTRQSLKEPFYSQSYAAAPFALFLGLGSILSDANGSWGGPAGAALMVVALIAYWVVQARWFARHLGASIWRGLAHASLALGATIALVLLAAVLIG